MSPECRHVKTDGLKCKAMALKGKPYCYYHARLHRLARGGRPPSFGPLKTSRDLEIALVKVLNAMRSAPFDARRTELYLWAIQIAVDLADREQSVPPTQPAPFPDCHSQYLPHELRNLALRR